MGKETMEFTIEGVPLKLFSEEERENYFHSSKTRKICWTIAKFYQEQIRNLNQSRGEE